jgi:putative phosphoesterase
MFKEFIQAGIPLHCVFGNNDGDRFLLTRFAMESNGLITLYPVIGHADAGGLKVAFTHEWPVAEGVAHTGKYDIVCFGHSHQHEQQRIGKAVVLNPGEIMGKDGDAGFCIVDECGLKIDRIPIG